MATTLDELVVKIQADVSGLRQEITEAQKIVTENSQKISGALEKMSENSGKHIFSFSQMLNTALGVFTSDVLFAAISKTKDALGELFQSTVVEGIRNAQEAEENLTRLNFALAQAGNYSTSTSQSITKFAEELQSVTKYEDDAIIKTSSIIETIGRLDRDALKVATRTALDLSTALGIDLNSAAELVGKAAQGNVGVFKRYGVELSEGATKSETFANAMTELNKRFGGAAASDVKTFSGSIAQLKNNWGNLTEGVGDAIIKNQVVIAVIGELSKVIKEANDWINSNSVTIKIWIAEGIIKATDALSALAQAADFITPVFRVWWAVLEDVGAAIGAIAASIVQLVQGNFSAASDVIKAFSEDVKKSFSGITDQSVLSKGLEAIASSMDKIGSAAKSNLSAVASGADATISPINQVHAAIEDVTAAQLRMAEAGKQLSDDLLKYDPSADVKQSLDVLRAEYDANLISLDEFLSEENELKNQAHQRDLESLEAAFAQDKISRDTYNAAKSASEKKYAQQEQIEAIKNDQLQRKLTEQRMTYMSQTFGNLSSLMRTKSAELFEIGKAAAKAQAIIDGIAAVQKTMASVPWPLSIPLAAAQAAAAAVNVANINQQQLALATGIDAVPGIGTADQVPAILAPGERVVPAETNRDLKAFLSMALSKMQSGGSSTGGTIQVELSLKDDLMNFIETKIVERRAIGVSILGATA